MNPEHKEFPLSRNPAHHEPNEFVEAQPTLKNLLIGKLILETAEYLEFYQTHLFRGYIGNQFPQYELLHNHQTEEKGFRYRYPLIQYKIIQGLAMILAIGEESIRVLETIAPYIQKLVLNSQTIFVQRKSWEVESFPFGISPEEKRYIFVTPSILLNSSNYKAVRNSDDQAQYQILQKCIESNLISISKGLEYTVPSRIHVKYDLLSLEPVCLKGEKMIGFQGEFTVNFHIPNFLGIGKSSSRGYGCCMAIE